MLVTLVSFAYSESTYYVMYGTAVYGAYIVFQGVVKLRIQNEARRR